MKRSETDSSFRNLVIGVDTQVPVINGGYVTAINFDNAATTPPFFSVMREIENFAPWYSSIHRGSGYKSIFSSNLYEAGRDVIKNFVHADRERDVVIYTKNTTESINLLSYALYQDNKKQIILCTDMEHLANDLPWQDKFQVDYVSLDQFGRLNLEDFERKLVKYKGKVKLVTVTGASNVTGYVNPVHKLAALAHQHGAKIHVDGAQWVPHHPVDMKDYDSPEHIDYLSFSAHKMYAPFGAGALIGPRELFARTVPVYQGGGDVILVTRQFIEWDSPPDKNEAGTPNVMGVVALIAAIKTLKNIGMDVIHQYEKSLIDYAIEGLKNVPGLELYGQAETSNNRVSLISFNLPGLHHRMLAKILSQEAGIAVRSGLFCAHPYVEKLLHLSNQDLTYYQDHHNVPFPGLVRISLGLYNNCREINTLVYWLNLIAANKDYFIKKYSTPAK